VGTNSGENGGSPMQVEAMTPKNGENRGRTNATVTNNANEADGMKTFNSKIGFIEVRFMTGISKGFNVARALKQFLAAARGKDNESTILPLSGNGNNLCISAVVPNTKDVIEQYFRHEVKFHNVNGKLRIHASKDIGQLKRGRSTFRVYLENQWVYINKAQLGEEEDITLGWILKAHPAFCFRYDMKEDLYNMMGEAFKGVQYALFPKNIKNKRSRYGAKMSTNGITLKVTKTPGITAAYFRAEMAENWQKLTAKNGGTLFGKTFIPVGKEGGIGDEVMTNIIQKQNNFLCSTTQRIVQNLNDIDCPIDIISGSGEELGAAKISLRDIFYKYKDVKGKQLVDAIERKNTGGTYRFLFGEKKIELIDNMLTNLDAILDDIGAWGDCDVHYRYMTAYPISVVGRVARATPTAFWNNHLLAFKSNGIPTEIDTQEIQYSTKKRAPWVKASYSNIARGNLPATTTDTTIANTSSQGQEHNSKRSGTGDGYNRPESQTDSPGAITGISNLKRKMATIDLERDVFKVDQA
jgi:hypothetical protein